MRRLKMIIAYDGGAYHGFQRQANAHTIQAELEASIFRLSGERVTVSGASRTDAGVHAQGQVIAFDTTSPIPDERFGTALNRYLPAVIRVLNSVAVADDFHPALAARSKTYAYRIWRERSAAVFYRQYALIHPEPLDIDAMQSGAVHLPGQHNFRAFCSSGGSNQTFEREIHACAFRRQGSILTLEISGNGFLYNMVRIIVGTLLEVGRGRIPPEQIQEIIASRERSRAGPTAPPQGLMLMRVDYP